LKEEKSKVEREVLERDQDAIEISN